MSENEEVKQEAELSPAQQKLTDLRKRRAEAEAKAEAAAQERLLREQMQAEEEAIGRAERRALVEDLIVKYCEKEGIRGIDWDLLVNREGIVMFRKPPFSASDQLSDRTAKNEMTAASLMDLLSKCLIFPTVPELVLIRQKAPVFIMQCANQAYALGKGRDEEVSGKS